MQAHTQALNHPITFMIKITFTSKAGYHCPTLPTAKAVTDAMKLKSMTAFPSHITQFHLMVISNP